MVVPNPVRLCHITALSNLPSIAQRGALLAKNVAAAGNVQYQNIAYAGAQGARARKLMPQPPGGMLHDYVPFYFAPRSPMLMAVDAGRVPDFAATQEDVIHLETTVDAVLALGQDYVFFDRNATLAYSQAYTDVAHLHVIAWDLLHEIPQLDGFCKFFQNRRGVAGYEDRMERRQAEFLVRQQVLLSSFTRIGVCTQAKASQARGILAAAGVPLRVEVCRDWYFLGQ
jgi:ssDNA thymidine ADP-ribosyltransferase, DarT